ncbi:MAG: T9SS type A sorting domain-containing protein [Bacteroidota bacterium]
MRSIILTIVNLVFSFSCLNAGSNNNELLRQLSAVNTEWGKQPECKQIIKNAPVVTPRSNNDWIVVHLALVEQTLRARNRSGLSTLQKSNRLRLLNELNAYWHGRGFPVNDYLPYKNPIFIDRTGNHCAVGYLMQQSGAENLAQKINNEQQFAYVHEIKVKGVKEWAKENGFTVDELAWIQPAYQVQINAEDMDGGLNGTVNSIAVDQNSQTVYAGGSFNQSISGAVCQNVAAWISGFAGWDWIPLGNGVNGPVHTLLFHNNKLYVGGEFTMASGIAAKNVAVYDIGLGQWQAMGLLDSTVRAFCVYNNEVYAGGDFSGYVAKWIGGQWQDVTQGFIYGEGVRTLEVWSNLVVIGGDFELATGALRKHVATYNGSQIGILGFGTPTPVNDFTEHEGKLTAACDVIKGSDTCALAVYDTGNGEWGVTLKPFGGIADAFEGNSIKRLHSNGNQLLAAGAFLCSTGMTYGNNLMAISKMTYDTTTYTIYQPLASTDQPVNDILLLSNILYFGGSFITNGYIDTLNRIGYLQLDPLSSGDKFENKVVLNLFPNPAGNLVHIQSSRNEKIEYVEVYDIAGRKIIYETVNATSKEISLQNLSAGIYTVRALANSGWGNLRLVKE